MTLPRDRRVNAVVSIGVEGHSFDFHAGKIVRSALNSRKNLKISSVRDFERGVVGVIALFASSSKLQVIGLFLFQNFLRFEKLPVQPVTNQNRAGEEETCLFRI